MERILSVAGNLRDLGGLRTADGRAVRAGLLFRSAAPRAGSSVTAEFCRKLGIGAVFDLRSAAERGPDPIPHPFGPEVFVWRNTSDRDAGDPAHIIDACLKSRAETREVMIGVYAEMPARLAIAISALVNHLLDKNEPILFHCAAGKDRTGFTAAILLALLGVSRNDIYADYLETNKGSSALIADFLRAPRHCAVKGAPQEVWTPMLTADAQYLKAAFAAIDRRWGGVEAYAEDALGVSRPQLARMRRQLLAPPESVAAETRSSDNNE